MLEKLFHLQNNVAVITGGGTGLGKQMAEVLAACGCRVALCSRKVDNCQKAAETLQTKYGTKAKGYQCFVQKEESVQQFVSQVIDEFGQIDILINNSGTTWGASVEEMPLEAWQKVIDVNVTGTFLMSKEVGKTMMKQKYGKIINIGSVAGMKAEPPEILNAIGYSTSKAAIHHFTKDLARKWAKYNIYVNAIAPGFFHTKMTDYTLRQKGDEIKKRNPLGKIGDFTSLQGAVLFFASPASNFVTGQILAVDGGSSL
ncbi:SDR family oxidoreductase [Bacillus alveayuensis]|jgi:NAD(P)-dependent dehydrogenase (short-subunit alcohol dehydrogenase family)|nr:SDR family oxidoreductase [Bacillus alveayuensis]